MEYFIGVLPNDRQVAKDFIEELNSIKDSKINIKGEYDDPDGYYTFVLDGTIESYDLFMNQPFIKSLENFWEDI